MRFITASITNYLRHDIRIDVECVFIQNVCTKYIPTYHVTHTILYIKSIKMPVSNNKGRSRTIHALPVMKFLKTSLNIVRCITGCVILFSLPLNSLSLKIALPNASRLISFVGSSISSPKVSLILRQHDVPGSTTMKAID